MRKEGIRDNRRSSTAWHTLWIRTKWYCEITLWLLTCSRVVGPVRRWLAGTLGCSRWLAQTFWREFQVLRNQLCYKQPKFWNGQRSQRENITKSLLLRGQHKSACGIAKSLYDYGAWISLKSCQACTGPSMLIVIFYFLYDRCFNTLMISFPSTLT